MEIGILLGADFTGPSSNNIQSGSLYFERNNEKFYLMSSGEILYKEISEYLGKEGAKGLPDVNLKKDAKRKNAQWSDLMTTNAPFTIISNKVRLCITDNSPPDYGIYGRCYIDDVEYSYILHRSIEVDVIDFHRWPLIVVYYAGSTSRAINNVARIIVKNIPMCDDISYGPDIFTIKYIENHIFIKGGVLTAIQERQRRGEIKCLISDARNMDSNKLPRPLTIWGSRIPGLHASGRIKKWPLGENMEEAPNE